MYSSTVMEQEKNYSLGSRGAGASQSTLLFTHSFLNTGSIITFLKNVSLCFNNNPFINKAKHTQALFTQPSDIPLVPRARGMTAQKFTKRPETAALGKGKAGPFLATVP